MQNISIFKNLVNRVKDESFQAIFEIIKSDHYKNEILAIRSALKDNNKAEADKLKKKLTAFTPAGSFLTGRKAELITTYSNHLVLDVDKIEPSQLEAVKNKANLAPYSLGVFTSPSGNGIKIIVQTNAKLEQHKEAMAQVSEYYEIALELPLDPSGKDVSRLCFFSYDPDIRINYQASVFAVEAVAKPTEPIAEPFASATALQQQFANCVQFTENVKQYQEGNRNNFIHLLTANCNRWGITEADSLQFIVAKYTDLTSTEIEATVKNTYKNNIAQFATFAKSANTANIQSEEEDKETIDYLKETPTIPEHVLQTLPDILIDALRAFQEPRRKDVFLTSALVVLSGCLPDVTGVYGDERVFTHLFSFIIAPPASGKGVLKNAKRLGDKIHETFLEASKIAQKEYEEKLAEYNQVKRIAKKTEDIPPKPEEPNYKLLFIPADCSQSRMVQLLNNNDGQGIICETEADAMSGANKQDWGNYSHLLRAAFHHEKISLSRKTDNEMVEIQVPRIAVALSGTPSQVPKLIASAEDGLFSRFLFYAFKSDIKWLDPSPKSGSIVHNDHFEKLGAQVFVIFNYLMNSPTNVLLSHQQWDKLNNAFEGKLNNVALFTGEEAISVVFRLGLIVFRFCMIFTALRKFENGDLSENLECIDQDFDNALSLSDVYLQHSLLIFNNLSEKDKKQDYCLPDNKLNFFKALPNTVFQRKEAVVIGKQFEMSPRSVDSFLKNSIGSLLTCLKTGYYQKKEPEA